MILINDEKVICSNGGVPLKSNPKQNQNFAKVNNTSNPNCQKAP